jgi:hypothetical protein
LAYKKWTNGNIKQWSFGVMKKIGVMECWSNEVMETKEEGFRNPGGSGPILHYSSTPVFLYSSIPFFH